jgi:hypothetical protein
MLEKKFDKRSYKGVHVKMIMGPEREQKKTIRELKRRKEC